MKKIITLLMISMLAFSIFGADTTTTLNIIATVAKITPTYSLTGNITYGKNDGNGATAETTTEDVTVDEDSSKNITLENARFTNNTDVDKDDKKFTVNVSLIQKESRWAEDVTVKFTFSKISYSTTATGNQNTAPEGKFETDYPSSVTANNRTDTVALKVGTLDVSSLSTDGSCTTILDYSVFGYFIKSGITVTTLTATYDIPTWQTDNTDDGGYFPFGTYTGIVKVTISGK